jgi:hypothetical protein
VSSVLAAYVPGSDHALAERAAHVAHELKLAAAAPALVSCVERLPQGDPVASVSCAALELIGRPAIGPVIEALARAAAPDVRFALGLALTLLPADDGRVRATLEGLLARDPDQGAQLLGVLGDRRAVPALRAALARAPFPAGTGPEALDPLDTIVALGEAILALGGRMTKSERAKFDGACARADPRPLERPDAPGARLH